jgi:hypothetical protein
MDKYKISKTVSSSAGRGAVAETERNGGGVEAAAHGGAAGGGGAAKGKRGVTAHRCVRGGGVDSAWRNDGVHTGSGFARDGDAADGGRNGVTLGRAAGVARWSSRTGPRQARLKHRPAGQRGRLREGKAQRRST